MANQSKSISNERMISVQSILHKEQDILKKQTSRSWTPEEENKLISLYEIYGPDYVKLASLIKNKTRVQIQRKITSEKKNIENLINNGVIKRPPMISTQQSTQYSETQSLKNNTKETLTTTQENKNTHNRIGGETLLQNKQTSVTINETLQEIRQIINDL